MKTRTTVKVVLSYGTMITAAAAAATTPAAALSMPRSSSSSTTNSNIHTNTICVIGGGPGALFFCHALETQKQALIHTRCGGSYAQFCQRYPAWPSVTCYERASGPGGVWRSDRSHEHADPHKEHERNSNSNSVTNDPSSDTSMENTKEEETDTVGTATTTLTPASSSSSLTNIITAEVEVETEEVKTKKPKTEEALVSAAAAAAAATTTLAAASQSTNMYSALWTNGSKEAYEFSDYTFVDHFGRDIATKLPTYLPRTLVLDYMIGRCTRKCPKFFDTYNFTYQTTVMKVNYLHDDKNNDDDGRDPSSDGGKFQIMIRDCTTGQISHVLYDRCLWAGGLEGTPHMPPNIVQLFETAGTMNTKKKIRLVHSSDTSNFKHDVENKNVLIIGGGLSAEDLILMAIKEGVHHVYVSGRSDDLEAMEGLTSSRWPYDKVTLHLKTCVTGVHGTNNDVTLTGCERCEEQGQYYIPPPTAAEKKNTNSILLKNIDTVILCTGYKPNFTMLNETLHPSGTKDASGGGDDTQRSSSATRCRQRSSSADFCLLSENTKIHVPTDWKMHDDDVDIEPNCSSNNCTREENDWDEKDWNDLPENIQKAAGVLGYDQKTWDDDDDIETPHTEKDWQDLSDELQTAAKTLGYTKERWMEDHDASSSSSSSSTSSSSSSSSLSLPSPDEDHTEKSWLNEKDWDALPDGIKKAAAVLGFDEMDWNEASDGKPRFIEIDNWQDLSDELRTAAETVGYSKKLWMEAEEGKYDLYKYLSSLHNDYSRLVFGENYKQIENGITPSVGDVSCDKGKCYGYLPHRLYRCMFLIDNPKMMYMRTGNTEVPLMEREIAGWMIAKVVSNQVPLPATKQEMIDEGIQLNLYNMKDPIKRYEMDLSYRRAVNDMKDPKTGKFKVNKKQIQRCAAEINYEHYHYPLYSLGKYMLEYNYPVSFLELYNKESDDISDDKKKGDSSTTTTTISYCHSDYYRTLVEKGECEDDNSRVDLCKFNNEDDFDEKGRFWRTFRDHPRTKNFVSYFTGIKSVPLPKKWFDLDEDDKLW